MKPSTNTIIKQENLKKENKKLKSELEELKKNFDQFRKEMEMLVKGTTTKKPVIVEDTEMEEDRHDVVQAVTHHDVAKEGARHGVVQAVTHHDVAKEGARQDVVQAGTQNDGFQIVTNKRQKKRQRSDEEEEKKETNEKTNKKGKTEIIGNKEQMDKKEEVPPPITVKVKDWNLFSSHLIKEKINYNKARNTQDGIRISPNTPSDYRNLIKSCELMKTEYYTYTLKEDKKNYYVIKGLHISANCQDVENELKELGANDAEVTRLISRRTKQPTAVLQLKTNYEQIKEITRLRYMVIKIETKRKDKGPIQCYRCQQYGHTRRNCGFVARCVRCGQQHESNDCKLEKTAGRNATCANCRGNHPANYKGCEYAAKNKKPSERKQMERKQEEKNKNKLEENIKNDKQTPKKSQEDNKLKELENRMDKMMTILQKLMEAQQRNG